MGVSPNMYVNISIKIQNLYNGVLPVQFYYFFVRSGNLELVYLYFVFGVRLESGDIIGGHFWIASVEPQRLAVVLVNSLLTQRDIN